MFRFSRENKAAISRGPRSFQPIGRARSRIFRFRFPVSLKKGRDWGDAIRAEPLAPGSGGEGKDGNLPPVGASQVPPERGGERAAGDQIAGPFPASWIRRVVLALRCAGSECPRQPSRRRKSRPPRGRRGMGLVSRLPLADHSQLLWGKRICLWRSGICDPARMSGAGRGSGEGPSADCGKRSEEARKGPT